jgi:Mrp family chromosome partitioning ATPase/capsular polysaccharide biosynthesis protein
LTPPPSTDRSRFRAREGALAPYFRAIQAHRLIFVLVVLATVAAATVWTSTAQKEYSASAEILVTPLPQDNQSFLGFDLLRDSGDPTRTVQTAAALIETREAADQTAAALNDGRTGVQILDSISVQPAGESNVIDVTATAESPTLAALTANAFTIATLQIRRERLEAQVAEEIARLQAGPVDSDTQNRIDTLTALKEHGDPTLALAQRATPSSSPNGASAAIVIGLALLAGLAIGTATAVVLELTAHKIRDEEEAVELYPLPILARVPVLPRSTRRQQAAGRWPMPPSVREPFRTVMTQLQSESSRRVVMLTSGSTGDGKTTSSINLAMTMALGGHSTILMDTDLRKPGVGSALQLPGGQSPSTVLDDPASIERSLVAVPGLDTLRVLNPSAFGAQDETLIERFAEQLPAVLEQVSKLAEYVVVDTPPLGEISDALRITPYADDVIVVTYPGNTNRANYEIMRDLLERSGAQPTGLLVIGDRTGASTTYYGYGMEQQRRGLPDLADRQQG